MKNFYLISALYWALVCSTASAQVTKILDFDGSAHGSLPMGDFYYDGTFLYGMTSEGGVNNGGVGFKIKPDGTGYAKLFDFGGGTNGRSPHGSFISVGSYLYGTTQHGGSSDTGTVFKIKPDGTGYTTLLTFTGAGSGRFPNASLVSDGTYLYGMTPGGGTTLSGIVYKVKTDGTGYAKLLDLSSYTSGNYPTGALYYSSPYLYGMTQYGGVNGMGVIFRIKTDGTGFQKIFDFNGTLTGSQPNGALISDGTLLYGMTQFGGVNNMGVIFKIKTDGSGYLKLYDFAGIASGSYPAGSLMLSGTTLFGMTQNGGANNQGVIFSIQTDGSGYVKRYSFSLSASGAAPLGSLISDGVNLYGMDQAGGANNKGVIFKYALTTAISETAADKMLSPYPNPFSDRLVINDAESITLYDCTGKIILDRKNLSGDAVLNTESIAAGLYVLKVESASTPSRASGAASATGVVVRNYKVVKQQ